MSWPPSLIKVWCHVKNSVSWCIRISKTIQPNLIPIWFHEKDYSYIVSDQMKMKFRIFDLTSYFQAGAVMLFPAEKCCSLVITVHMKHPPVPFLLVCFVRLVFNLIMFTVVIGCWLLTYWAVSRCTVAEIYASVKRCSAWVRLPHDISLCRCEYVLNLCCVPLSMLCLSSHIAIFAITGWVNISTVD